MEIGGYFGLENDSTRKEYHKNTPALVWHVQLWNLFLSTGRAKSYMCHFIHAKNFGGAFFYPFYINNGNQLRNLMISHKVYIPTLWPNVKQSSNAQAMDFANNIVYIPIDQRYGDNEMNFILDMVVNYYDG